ncbi:RNase P and RNase MRP subunit [Friedmanniomyces endolithicus]|uniref:RNase P and RNase MRP subunit n=1 Tax=Friedmanniomyces endolithicus TaxID=329885 RepID=A0AAN6K8U7_9PEZI|nr:RNase P and RNase MRP subunit [Friedmanniomyces endolithicus]KAK0789784.1 RNase P and RNase MRP subunit [Friedmanniomyces endolithicus]KAK0795852.1 RNase P and RNase MRP subunit [Friedmanniomyces endolithicus]KAK0815861.1 RNase P and RNase MRP subunit [Friedmanniomyces endolithicus]KAK0837647.1 RNase P and RNase MRP subunit [Friedmanniomyces endolithicus]
MTSSFSSFLLSRLGEANPQHPRSKGKRSRKRKRQSPGSKTISPNPETAKSDPENLKIPKKIIRDQSLHSPNPDPHILIGFNAVTQHLEALSATSAQHLSLFRLAEVKAEKQPPIRHIFAVFLLRPLDELIYAHLPTLCYTASLAHPKLPATRLVLLDDSAETQIAGALGLARVSVLAILEPEAGSSEVAVPGMDSLMAYVREHVVVMGAGWLADAVSAKWLGTKVDVT